MALGDQIESFWSWFSENRANIQAVVDDNHHLKLDELVEGLDQHILGFGKLKWELNSPADSKYSLTISPNNDRDLLKITKCIVEQAPADLNWFIFHALQISNNFEISLYDADMEICKVDSSDWQIILEEELDGRNFLVIRADNMSQLDEDTELVAVDLVLTSLLGEELKINSVAGFDVVAEWDPVQKELAFPMKSLHYELTN